MIRRFDKCFKVGRDSTVNNEKSPPERRGGMMAYWSLSQTRPRWLMWSPHDIHAIPSEHDKISGREAILALEVELERAKEAVVQAQRRVDALQDNIRHRRACKEEWSAVLAIQAVSRHWRDVVRATPKAWNFIPWDIALSSPSLREAVPVFLERSSHQPRHINVPHSPPSGLWKLLKLYGSQVICMTNLYFFTAMDGLYPNMTTLRLDWDIAYSKVEGRDLSSVLKYFPNLKIFSLNIHGTPPDNFLFKPSALMPPLQHLEIRGVFPSEVTGLLKSCAETLTTLIFWFLRPEEADLSDPIPIHFPRLHSAYMGRTGEFELPVQKVIDASSPLLQNYVSRGPGSGVPISFDTRLVSRLDTNQVIDLSDHSNIETLGIPYSTGAMAQLQQAMVCPRLGVLAIMGHTYDQETYNQEMKAARIALRLREEFTGKPVRVVRHNLLVFSEEIRPLYQCDEGYNCRQRWEKYFSSEDGIGNYGEGIESDDE